MKTKSKIVLIAFAAIAAVNACGRDFASRITRENLDGFCYHNLADVKRPIRGIVIDHHGLGCAAGAKMVEYSGPLSSESGQGIVWIHPHYSPWAWMNAYAVKLCDTLIDRVVESEKLPADIPICSAGGSMGGQGAYVFAAYSRHNIRRVVSNCGVADLAYHFTERPDLPRTLTAAFGYAEDFDAELEARSPLALARSGKMPDIPYVIFHSTKDLAVNHERHSLPMVAALKEHGRKVEFHLSEGTGHGQLKPELRKRYFDAIRETFAKTEP